MATKKTETAEVAENSTETPVKETKTRTTKASAAAPVKTVEDRLAELEKATSLILTSQPIWIGYEEEDRRFLENWYTEIREKYKIVTKGIRD